MLGIKHQLITKLQETICMEHHSVHKDVPRESVSASMS